MNPLQQVKDKLVEGSVMEEDRTYCSMLEIEREFYPDTFNERKKRIEEIDPYPTPYPRPL